MPLTQPGPTSAVWRRAQQGSSTLRGTPGFNLIKQSFAQGPTTWQGSSATTSPTYAGPGSSASHGGSPGTYGDPAYELAKAFAIRSRKEAQDRALAKRRAAAIQYGSAAGLEGVLGGDFASVAQQASQNPFSVIANLKYGYDRGVSDLEEQLNKANLFYSGYRGEQLGDAAHQYQQAGYNANTQFQGLLTDVADQLAAALMAADQAEMMAALNAAAGSFPGGGGGGGGEGGGGSGYPPGTFGLAHPPGMFIPPGTGGWSNVNYGQPTKLLPPVYNPYASFGWGQTGNSGGRTYAS